MDVTVYMEGDYRDLRRFHAAKKQSQFKANLLAFSVLRSADSVKMRKGI